MPLRSVLSDGEIGADRQSGTNPPAAGFAADQLAASAFAFDSVTTAPFTVIRMNGLWWYPPTSTARVASENTRPDREISYRSS